MAAKYIRAILLPNLSSVAATAIASCSPYDDGVGLLNERGRMIGWIEIHAEAEDLRARHFEKVLRIINDVINNPRRSTQPDFSFLNTGL